jgi:hypothetical protein
MTNIETLAALERIEKAVLSIANVKGIHLPLSSILNEIKVIENKIFNFDLEQPLRQERISNSNARLKAIKAVLTRGGEVSREDFNGQCISDYIAICKRQGYNIRKRSARNEKDKLITYYSI